jgi:ubiquitin-like protein Pup
MFNRINKPNNDKASDKSDLGVTYTKSSTKGIDSVLDEIDAVLEKNAEEFVKGFIQKGGQ